MTEMPDNILHLPEYQVLGCKSTDDEMHFQVDAPDPIACEECGVQGEFVRFGKRDVPYRDQPIPGAIAGTLPVPVPADRQRRQQGTTSDLGGGRRRHQPRQGFRRARRIHAPKARQ